MYLSFEAPSIHGSESKPRNEDQGPNLQEEEGKPNEEAAPTMEEAPATSGETKPDSSSLVDEWALSPPFLSPEYNYSFFYVLIF